jgi:hypothetical protein
MAGSSLWKILLGIGILFSLVAFILGTDSENKNYR